MGSWDEGPRENDTALDHELHIFGCEGRGDLGPQSPEEQRYVAWLVTQLKPSFPRIKELAQISKVRMQALLDNNEWLADWKNEVAVIASINRQVNDLVRIIRSNEAEMCEFLVDFLDSCEEAQSTSDLASTVDAFQRPARDLLTKFEQ